MTIKVRAFRSRGFEKKEVETVNHFGPRFIENYVRANRQKASGIAK